MADPNTPSWLQEASVPVVPSAPTSSGVIATQSPPPASNNGLHASGASTALETSAATAEEAELPYMILVMRLANMGAAIVLIACSVRFKEPTLRDLSIKLSLQQ